MLRQSLSPAFSLQVGSGGAQRYHVVQPPCGRPAQAQRIACRGAHRARRRRTHVARSRRAQTHVAQRDARCCVDGARGPRARARRLPHTLVH